MEMDRRVCTTYLISVCIRMFLERRDRQLSEFVGEFKSLNAADEKIALMERFLAELWSQLEADSTSMIWSLMVSEEQQVWVKIILRRAIFLIGMVGLVTKQSKNIKSVHGCAWF